MREEGTRVRLRLIEVRYLGTSRARGRVGIVVPRFAHSAVERNRVKRRLREILRRELLTALPAVDVSVRASPLAYDASFEELRQAVATARRRVPWPER